MTKKVNIFFGGTVPANWLLLPEIATVYKQIADENGLSMQGFNLQFEDVSGERTLRRVNFHYAKTGLNENQLQLFNDAWASIAETHQVTRNNTSIGYYEE